MYRQRVIRQPVGTPPLLEALRLGIRSVAAGERHCFAPYHMHALAKRILFIAVVVPTLVTAFGASCPCPRGISVQPSWLAWPPGAQVIGAGPVGHGCLPLLGRAGAAGKAQ